MKETKVDISSKEMEFFTDKELGNKLLAFFGTYYPEVKINGIVWHAEKDDDLDLVKINIWKE